MNIKKIFLILVMILTLSGCTNIKSLSYDNIVNGLANNPKKTNKFKQGFQFYIPKGLSIDDAGSNYVILESNEAYYYLYTDLVSYHENKNFIYEINKNAIYSKKINYNKKQGFVEINLWENNQYLIEIMYNYAKIEVMVDESFINKALINSINILNSINYNDKIIESLLEDDNLTYTEEIFDMFEETKNDDNHLDYVDSDNILEEDKEEIKDTDFIN